MLIFIVIADIHCYCLALFCCVRILIYCTNVIESEAVKTWPLIVGIKWSQVLHTYYVSTRCWLVPLIRNSIWILIADKKCQFSAEIIPYLETNQLAGNFSSLPSINSWHIEMDHVVCKYWSSRNSVKIFCFNVVREVLYLLKVSCCW